MIASTVILSLSLFTIANAQVKACYAWDGSSSGNFPCDPEAEVQIASPSVLPPFANRRRAGERMLRPG